MPQTIHAVYEHGVFTPIEKVELRESSKVAIRIVQLDDWQDRFERLLLKVRSKSASVPSEEIESDITEAMRESRAERHGR